MSMTCYMTLPSLILQVVLLLPKVPSIFIILKHCLKDKTHRFLHMNHILVAQLAFHNTTICFQLIQESLGTIRA